jgi:hypothetical protein
MDLRVIDHHVLAFSIQSVAIIGALAVLLRFTVLYLPAEPTTAVDLWCGKTYKPQ